MLQKLLNECTFKLTITPVDPLLIKSGDVTVGGADMTPVRTWRNGKQEIFLPGSSLKGVVRSHAERVVRTIKDGIVCMPYKDVEKEQGCPVAKDYEHVFCGNKFKLRRGKPLNEELSNEQVYSNSCPACRLFGSTDFIGRIAISDAYLKEGSEPAIERRDGVGIDRFTGGAAHRAKFELEVVSSGIFETTVHLRNFEIWQLGMVAVVLQDFREELIRIGSGKSRGLGKVRGEISEFKIAFLKSSKAEEMPENEIWGLGKFLAGEQENYGTTPDDVLTLDVSLQHETNGIRVVLPLEGETLNRVLKKATTAFIEKMNIWSVPETMRFSHVKRDYKD
jgi:CRISPR-associated RAMP protein (TIGR02581 family)